MEMTREKLVELTKKYIDIGNEKFGVNLEYPTVAFFNKGTRAGTAWYFFNRIEYNEVLAKENPDTFESTVCHEVAHLFTHKFYPKLSRRQAHGKEFKYIMQTLGCTPRTRHSYDVSSVKKSKTVMRHEVKCSCTTHWVSTRIANSLSGRRCRICKSAVHSTGVSKQK